MAAIFTEQANMPIGPFVVEIPCADFHDKILLLGFLSLPVFIFVPSPCNYEGFSSWKCLTPGPPTTGNHNRPQANFRTKNILLHWKRACNQPRPGLVLYLANHRNFLRNEGRASF